MFPEVEVYCYVTEQTFDAYLYQLVEEKQKFIRRVVTSKSHVRSAEDMDEVALSFAEVKMFATGDERFKEKMKVFDTDLVHFFDEDFVCGEADIKDKNEDSCEKNAAENEDMEDVCCSDCPYFPERFYT